MKKLFGLFAVLCVLSACSEIELGSHIAKQVPKISGQKENVGYFKVGSPYRIKGRTYKPREKYQYSETGVASWYGPGFHGKMTANGEIFNKHELTAAHRTLQMPSMVRVTNLENGRSIIVRVNDRGPFAHDRVIDLSEKAAEIIGMKNQGTARVRVDVLEKESRQVASAAKNGRSTRGTEIALNRGQSISDDMPLVIAKPVSKPGSQIIQPTIIANRNIPERKMFDDILIKQAMAEPSRKPITARPIIPNQDIFVQTGAFTNEDNAMTMKMSLYNVGEDVRIHKSLENMTSIYRVKIGPVESVARAEEISSLLRRQGR
jgi:rare lipoprotein A